MVITRMAMGGDWWPWALVKLSHEEGEASCLRWPWLWPLPDSCSPDIPHSHRTETLQLDSLVWLFLFVLCLVSQPQSDSPTYSYEPWGKPIRYEFFVGFMTVASNQTGWAPWTPRALLSLLPAFWWSHSCHQFLDSSDSLQMPGSWVPQGCSLRTGRREAMTLPPSVQGVCLTI